MNVMPLLHCGVSETDYNTNLFAVMNTKQIYHDWNADYYYNVVHTGGGKVKASECIKCGKCERDCPQHLHIRSLLVYVVNEFIGKTRRTCTPIPNGWGHLMLRSGCLIIKSINTKTRRWKHFHYYLCRVRRRAEWRLSWRDGGLVL